MVVIIKNFYFNTDKMKICAYCRVSTDKSDQANSLENQIKYFTHYIKSMKGSVLQKVYVDEGITGTSTKRRKAFMEMIEDAKSGKIDFIITKEISRFARNTLDSIYYTRLLRELGVGVYFLNDNINTLDADSELRLTLMSSIAQEESRKTSERVKWGQKRQMEKGVVFGKSLLGYDVTDGKISINSIEAKMVKLIFSLYLNQGMSTYKIAEYMNYKGYKTKANGAWSNTAVLRILKNEKYCGDLIQKKTYTPNYLTHEKKKNKGQEELIIIRNHHAPIISKTLFKRVQDELKLRRRH